MTPAELRRLTEAAIESDLLHASGDVVIDAAYYGAVLDLIPPTTSEIIAAYQRSDTEIEQWSTSAGEWGRSVCASHLWELFLDEHGDQPQPGYRIVRGDQ